MKYFYLIFLLNCVGFSAFAGNDGGGLPGGGLIRNGQYITIGSAGDVIRLPVEENDTSIHPLGLQIIYNKLKQISIISDAAKYTLIQALEPSLDRKYLNITKISEENIEKLKQQYSSLLRLNPDTDVMTIYAFTSRSSGETYLLPDFYKLSDDISRAVIIWHESMFLVSPLVSLEQALKSQIALERLLRCSQNCTKEELDFLESLTTIFNLVGEYDLKYVNTEILLRIEKYALQKLAQEDFRSGALQGLMDDKGRVKLRDLLLSPGLNSDFFTLSIENNMDNLDRFHSADGKFYYSSARRVKDVDRWRFDSSYKMKIHSLRSRIQLSRNEKLRLFDLTQMYPKSLLMKHFLDYGIIIINTDFFRDLSELDCSADAYFDFINESSADNNIAFWVVNPKVEDKKRQSDFRKRKEPVQEKKSCNVGVISNRYLIGK